MIRIAVCATLLALSGCIVGSRHETRYEPPPATGPEGPNAGTIRAAMQLGYASDRARMLKKVAQRDDLTEAEQTLLIDAAFHTDLYRSDRSEILLALVSNAKLCSGPRNTIGSKIGELDVYESDRVRIVEAMDASSRRGR